MSVESPPPRPRPRHDRMPDNIADRIVALQRKNAAAGPSRPRRDDGFDRGQPPQRTLYDPSRPPPAAQPEEKHRRPPPPPPPPPPPSRKLFNPDIHDPHHFHPRPSTTHPHPTIQRRPERTPEKEADRERERRRRKEGSERSIAKPSQSQSQSQSRSSDGSESFKDRERGKGKGDSGAKAILKDIHNKIRNLETELTDLHKKMEAGPEAVISVAAWIGLIGKHKELADLHHLFLVRVFDPLVPTTYQQLAVKYNIPSRLWQVSFHLILERLRHAWMTANPTALDLLTDLVYDAYKFYTDLLEDQALSNFRTAWIEALGDLARYRMAIASHVGESSEPVVEIDDDAASIGEKVAQSWDVEDKETWRTTAREWYTKGVTEKPGEGRLHHHLALLCRDVRGLEGRALHHFTKSLVVTHQYLISRESLLPLFDSALQSQRSSPEAGAMDLFVRLHGMLFTRIDLDSFSPVMSRYMERLEEDARLSVGGNATITQVDWIIMAAVNLAAVLQYGTSGVVRKALSMEGQERRRQGDNSDSPPSPDEEVPVTTTFANALHLTFSVLQFTFANPTRQQGLHSVLNPYITTLLTFIGTLFRQPHTAAILQPHMPWAALVELLNTIPMESAESRLTGPPLPEDWALRGMEWVGRRVYERGFWKAKPPGRGSGAMAQPSRLGERFQSEMDVLLANFESAVDISEGVVDELDGTDMTDGPVAVNQRRWKRVAWAAGLLVKHVDGLVVQDGKVVIDGALKDSLEREEEAVAAARKEEAVAATRMVEVEEVDDLTESEDDDPELAELRERRRHLRSLLNPSPSKRTSKRTSKPKIKSHVVPGYTMLVFDTNVLLSSLSLFERIVAQGKWSVIVPLPVITELDGLSKNASPLGTAAAAAIIYLESHIRTHSTCLKIQTSRGNYLSDLLIRNEAVDFSDRASRNMDDLILNIASFQSEHFVDRSALLGGQSSKTGSKVLLVTFDRNLRLRARARGIDAADEKEMARILGR